MSGRTPYFPLLLLLFVGSGCAALIYEVIWFQLLQVAIGSTAVSLGVLLGSFMGGMCLGSLYFARFVSVSHHPLRTYALLEAGIGVCGLSLLFLLPRAGQAYAALGGGIALRATVCALCLLPPTVLMGATLPAIARWVETTPAGVSKLGFFYGANLGGAVFGCLLAGFYLLRVHDLTVSSYVAATINGVVALIGLALARSAPYTAPAASQGPAGGGKRLVYVAIALSGLSALGAEVVWTRLLSLLLGPTVYTFSIILAVFLTGLGLGSSAGSRLARTSHDPRTALGVCQLGAAFSVAWAAYAVTASLPYWPIDVSLVTSPWISLQLDIVRCLWAVLPAACFWGASFPLALAAAAKPGQDPGRLAGSIYAANTLGAISGALLFSLTMITWLGTERSQQVLIAVSILAAALMLAPALHSGRARLPAAALVTAVAVIATVPAIPAGLVAYGRYLPTYAELPDFLYVGEGMNASVAVSEWPEKGTREFHVSGKVVASSQAQDMSVQRMLGHLPALIHPKPKSVLIVGCGAGVTAGTFVVHPDIERIVICEIEPLIPPAAARYFDVENFDVMKDPRVEIIYDDARHFLATTKESFDIITSDPIHPWVKGAAALYSTEYFSLTKRHLNPGGVVTQWAPLYESNPEAANSQIATFMLSFPDGAVWSNLDQGEGYDLVLVAQDGPMRIDVAALDERLNRPDHQKVLRSLRDVGLGSAVSLLSTYAGRGPDLAGWIDKRNINSDLNMRLQYLAGFGLNYYQGDAIYRSILAHRKFPDDLIVAAGEQREQLRTRLERP